MSKPALNPALADAVIKGGSGPVTRVVAIIGEGETATKRQFNGRFAHTLWKLIEAGEAGVSSIEQIGPRLSHYIFKLRRWGLAISMVEEKHKGPFPGWHGRYILGTAVRVLEAERA